MDSRSKSLLKDVIIIAAGVLIIWLAMIAVFGTTNPFYVVSSGSMVPELNVYDIIVVRGHDRFEDVQVGDIIVFDRPSDHDRVIVHRVAAIIDDDPLTVRTQGDANPASIPGTDFPITAEEYIGTVVHVVPQVGYVTRIFSMEIGGIPLNYVIIAIIIGFMIFKTFSAKKEPKRGRDPEPAEFSADIPEDSEYSLDMPGKAEDSGVRGDGREENSPDDAKPGGRDA